MTRLEGFRGSGIDEENLVSVTARQKVSNGVGPLHRHTGKDNHSRLLRLQETSHFRWQALLCKDIARLHDYAALLHSRHILVEELLWRKQAAVHVPLVREVYISQPQVAHTELDARREAHGLFEQRHVDLPVIAIGHKDAREALLALQRGFSLLQEAKEIAERLLLYCHFPGLTGGLILLLVHPLLCRGEIEDEAASPYLWDSMVSNR